MTPQTPVVPGLEEYEIKIAESQDEYGTLPAIPVDNEYMVSRWRLTWRERLIAFLQGDVYLSVWTFGHPMQPVMLQVDEPHLAQPWRD